VSDSFSEILSLALGKCTVVDDSDSDDGISMLLEADKNADEAIESLKNLDLSSLSLSATTVDDSTLDVEVPHLMEDGIKWSMDAKKKF